MIKSLVEIRQHLHQNPELSEEENKTAEFIEELIKPLNPDSILRIGFSRVFVFDSGHEGPVIAFRADMDALPIEEKNTILHVSKVKGVSHVCGHDGHMSILIGFAREMVKQVLQKGKVILVFQSAEETGQGARQLLESEDFKKLNIDYIFGLHNIPNFELGQVLVRKGSFASASRGMIVQLQGKTSHAAEPENGINPALAIAQITQELHKLIGQKDNFESLTLLTFIYTKMGEIAFGTSAGDAEMGFTLRAFENSDMDSLVTKVEQIIRKIADENQLLLQISYTEEFPGTISSEKAYQLIVQSAKRLKHTIVELDEPMRWSEDFGYYSKIAKTGFFGLGSGIDQPQLHHPDFDFPNELIEKGVSIFLEILKSFC